MSKNIGTLVGAPIRPNDSLDQYPTALAAEIQGGLHTVTSEAAMDAMPTFLRVEGMQCYCQSSTNTYELAADLVTWNLLKSASGGSTDPGTGGTSTTVQLISGNFGAWTDPDNKSTEFVNENFPLQFKADLQAFPTRAIVYVQGQFGLNGAFVGTSLLLGTLPLNSRPAQQLKKYFICQNIELFLVIDTTGDITIVCKDEGFNLPVTTGTPEPQPYYVECFFNPVITTTTPTTWTSTRTASFTRNNCDVNYDGSSVAYSQNYTSTVDQATADAIAAADTNFDTAGQAYANANGTCTYDPTFNAFVTNNRNAGSQEVVFTDSLGAQWPLGGTTPGNSAETSLTGTGPYSVLVQNSYGPDLYVRINGGARVLIPAFANQKFTGFSPTITVVVGDN